MTFVKTKIELSKLQPGDILEVLLALSVEHVEGTTHKVTIKK